MSRILLKQLFILLWKHWITRFKHLITTIFELFGPLFLAVIIAYLYSISDYNTDDNKWKGPVFNSDPQMTLDFGNKTLNFTSIIYYTPNNSLTNGIMNRIEMFDSENLLAISVKDVKELTIRLRKQIQNNISNSMIISGVIFDKSDVLSLRLEYTIMTNGFRPKHVNKYFGRKLTAGPDLGVKAYPQMFCKIQTLINEVYLTKLSEKYNKTRTQTASVKAYKYPYPKYRDNGDEFFMISIQELIGSSIVLGYLVTCPLIVKRISDEKAIKAKELLRMIGMSDWVFWSSHFFSYFPIMFFHNICFALIYYVGFGKEPIYQYLDPTLFFIILTIYNIQNILFCMSITTVFNQPVFAVVVTVVLYLSTFSLTIGLIHPALHMNMDIIETNSYRMVTCVLPNLGLIWCLAVVGQFEVHSIESGWKDLFEDKGTYGGLTIGLILLIMISSSIVFGISIWYIDAVWPFQFGVPKPLYFPCKPSYYCPKEKTEKVNEIKENVNFESEPNGFRAVIKIKNISKSFGSYGYKKFVVNNVSLNIFNGQITALLGHNGAGKTTTMNMITGIFPPTSGTIHLDGYSVVTNTNKARKSIGLCPQENIIYEELTVGQHLKLYATIKDIPMNLVNKEVETVLTQLKLIHKKNKLAIELSGGMKRRLQLGIALIGGTKTLILDEPTSGLDPEARRVIWNLLQEMRKNKTILITTHYMEEADAIADRIAIMSEGRVKCCGSPMFLKTRFGAGYHLRVSKGIGFDAHLMEETLQKHLPEARVLSEIGTEIIYSLESQNSAQNGHKRQVFADLFTNLENNKTKLKLDSYGLSLTSLEDIFINILMSEEKEEKTKHVPIESKVNTNLKSKGIKLYLKQIYGLSMKRVHFAKRYWPMFIFQILLPALLFILVFYCDYGMRNLFKSLSRNLTIDMKTLYGNTFGFFKPKHKNWQNFGREVYSLVAYKHGINTSILGSNEDPNVWASKHSNPVVTYVRRYLTGAVFDENEKQHMLIDSWYSNEALHSLPMSLNIIYESLAKHFIPELNDKKVSIIVHNQPIGLNEDMITFGSIIFSYCVTCLLLTPLTVPFLGASFVLFPIHERVTKSKLLQLMNGLSPTMFWLTNFVFDLFTHTIAVIIIFIVCLFFDFNNTYFGQTNTAVGLLLMLFLFGMASIPTAYCFSFIFQKSSTGYAILVIIYLLFGLIFNLIMSIFDIYINLRDNDIIPIPVFNTMLAILRLFPVFSMCFGIQKLYRTGAFAQQCKEWSHKHSTDWTLICGTVKNKTDFFWGCCREKCEKYDECYESKSPFNFDSFGIATEFIYLIVDCFLYFLLLWLLEGNLRNMFRIKPKNMTTKLNKDRDSDVVLEEHRIEELKTNNGLYSEAMIVYKMTKYFGDMTAVDEITFDVHKEECFGLLGVNGAGKTTLFSMLTGDISPNNGNAYINGYELINHLTEFQKQIGYCPQFDPLLDKLTGEEMLYLFARLRGIRSSLIAQEVKRMIQMADLEKHANKCTENYSGGNKRKLSLALAIIGNPPIIFLDEPTAGVDPFARRKIWSTLEIIRKTYRSALILTSHSMEESEALCGRIAIMVRGRFLCMGSTQHLRSKFGQGFSLRIKLKYDIIIDSNYIKSVQKFVEKSFESAILKDSHQCLLYYHITDPTIKWSYIFNVMESAKSQFNLEDYNVSDTSLEQIFLSFAETQYKTEK